VKKPFLPMLWLALSLGAVTALSACGTGGSNPPSAAEQNHTSEQSVYAAVQSYTATAREETRLIKCSGSSRGPSCPTTVNLSSGTVAEMKRLDNVAYNGLVPLRDAARAGQPINGRDLASAQSAVAAFTTYVAQNGGTLTP
jgi:hypothetical protein